MTNLNKGYYIIMDKNKVVKSIDKIKINKKLSAKLKDGLLEVDVKKIN